MDNEVITKVVNKVSTLEQALAEQSQALTELRDILNEYVHEMQKTINEFGGFWTMKEWTEELLEDKLSECCGASITEAGEFCTQCREHC